MPYGNDMYCYMLKTIKYEQKNFMIKLQAFFKKKTIADELFSLWDNFLQFATLQLYCILILIMLVVNYETEVQHTSLFWENLRKNEIM